MADSDKTERERLVALIRDAARRLTDLMGNRPAEVLKLAELDDDDCTLLCRVIDSLGYRVYAGQEDLLGNKDARRRVVVYASVLAAKDG